MPIISVGTQPADGTSADAADVNNQINAILAVVNGQLDYDNIANGGITNVKLAGGITIDKLAASALQGWAPISAAPNSVTPYGNGFFDVVWNSLDLTSVIGRNMKLRFQRSVAAPPMSALLNGSTHYFSKSSPAGTSFTDDFTASAWIKLDSYGSTNTIVSRYNGTSGWAFYIDTLGRVVLAGNNAGGSNYRYVVSHQSIPVGKWVHVAAQLDMSGFTTATCKVFINGAEVAGQLVSGGTNPTSLVQAGNLEVGSQNGGSNKFKGNLQQVAYYSSLIAASTILNSMNQGLLGSETNLVSAYSLSNSVNDLNTGSANNLTAQGSATTTTADSPFANAAAAGLYEYAEVMKTAFSTNTTVTVRVPNNCVLPQSGGIAAAWFSTSDAPFGMPRMGKLLGMAIFRSDYTQGTTVSNQWYDPPALTTTVKVPFGARVRLSAFTPTFQGNVGTPPKYRFAIRENSTVLVSSADQSADANENDGPHLVTAHVWPSEGDHTYKASMSVNQVTNLIISGTQDADSNGNAAWLVAEVD